MTFILILIIIIALWKYIPKQLQNHENKEPPKTEHPGIFSNISEWNDDNENKNKEPPKFQIDPNLFTIDGLDRFFDSMIEFIKTGKSWEFVKNWLQKSKIELPFFYIGIGVIFLIFGELIFILWIIIVVIYFVVKQIKVYRDKNPWFGSFSSVVHTPQFSVNFEDNHEKIYWRKNEIWMNAWFTDRNHISWIIWLLFLVILNNRQFDSDGGASILDLILVYGTYALFLYWFVKMVILPISKISQARETIVFFLKKAWKYLWYLFLFLIIVAYIVYKFFLPSDIQKEIETEALTYGFAFRLWVWDIDPPETPCYTEQCGKPEQYYFAKDAAKRCAGYVHREVCESVLADTIYDSSYGLRSLYEYCTESENVKKEYCALTKFHMQAGTFHMKYIEIKKIFDEWKWKNPALTNITLKTDSSTEWYATKAHVNISCDVKNCTVMNFGKVLFDVFCAKFHKTAPYSYYDNLFTIRIEDETMDHPEKLVEILDLVKETIEKEKEKSVQSVESPEEIDTETEQELSNLINTVSP